MKKFLIYTALCLVFNSNHVMAQNLNYPPNPTPEINQAKKIQLVFCLDATGSMGGLIETAKQKIWSIASTLLQADPKPELELGLLFYRDRGDEFITKPIFFSTNIDSLYSELMDIKATGGNDAPESVNQALFEAVNSFGWSKDTSVYKAIFLIGDCPPHMDYPDDIKYPVSCRKALKDDIIINTLQMGNCHGATEVWQKVATITGGDYISVDQKANGYVVKTPCDEELARLQNQIDNTVLYYGTPKIRISKTTEIKQANKIYNSGKASENASRAEYKKTKGASSDNYYKHDLVTDVANGKVSMDTLKDVYLPDTLKGKSLDEKLKYVNEMKVARDTAQLRLGKVMEQRNAYIKAKTESETSVSSNSFSNKVYDSMKKQSAKKGVVLKTKVKE